MLDGDSLALQWATLDLFL